MFQLSLSTALTSPTTPGAGLPPALSGAFSAALAGLVGAPGTSVDLGGAVIVSRQPNADGGKSLPSIAAAAADPALAWLDNGQPIAAVLPTPHSEHSKPVRDSLAAATRIVPVNQASPIVTIDAAAPIEPVEQPIAPATASTTAPLRFAPATTHPKERVRPKHSQEAAATAGDDAATPLPLKLPETSTSSDLLEPATATPRHEGVVTHADSPSDEKDDTSPATAPDTSVAAAIVAPPIEAMLAAPITTIPKPSERPSDATIEAVSASVVAAPVYPTAPSRTDTPVEIEKGEPAVESSPAPVIEAIHGVPKPAQGAPAPAATSALLGATPVDGNHPPAATTSAPRTGRSQPLPDSLVAEPRIDPQPIVSAQPSARPLAAAVSAPPAGSAVAPAAAAPTATPTIRAVQADDRQNVSVNHDARAAAAPLARSGDNQPPTAAPRSIPDSVIAASPAIQSVTAPRQPLTSDATLTTASAAPVAMPQTGAPTEQPRSSGDMLAQPVITRATTNDAAPQADTATQTTPPPPAPVTPPPARPAAMVFGIALGGLMLDRRSLPAERPSPRNEALQALTALAGPGPASSIAATGAAQHSTLDMHRDDWPQAMIDRIEALRDAADATSTRITLAPDALGKVDLSIRQDGDAVHVHFTADVAQTRAILADAQPKLAELAQARGLRLGQATVDAGAGGGGQRQQPGTTAPQPQRPASAFTTTTADDAGVTHSTRLA